MAKITTTKYQHDGVNNQSGEVGIEEEDVKDGGEHGNRAARDEWCRIFTDLHCAPWW